ncbi:MAG: TIM barrel protein [Methanosarcinales archaeon]|nr:TIM barrel protein [Methanosarcinales archaeon]
MFLTNISTPSLKAEFINEDWNRLIDFLKRHKLDGIELFFQNGLDIEKIPKNIIHGLHLKFWPIWLDFWKEDEKACIKQFGSLENIEMFYGGTTPDVLIEHYKNEFCLAKKLNVKYMVFHVSHVEMEHIFTKKFSYSDWDVLEASIELINASFDDENCDIKLLFENLWWPGLNFLNPTLTKKFFKKIKYQNKGFLLDLGHMMITNPNLTNEIDAKDYIIDKIDRLGNLKSEIYGMHINSSLTGEYFNQKHTEKMNEIMNQENIWDKYIAASQHIKNIDTHMPFKDECLQEIIEFVNPLYKVFEVLPNDYEEFDKNISIQNKALNR